MNFYYWLGYHLSRLLAQLFFGFRIINRERVIQTGPVILAMNHQSFFDPKLNVISVNLEGGDRSALKALIRILSAGECALVFPEGSRTPDGNLHPALPGLGLLIAKTRAPVVPMRIFGAFDAWPIHGKIHLWRKITIVAGEPIYFSDADLGTGGKDLYTQLSQRVMDAIAALQLP